MLSIREIDIEARQLLASIEKNAKDLWPNTQPDRLFMCDPEAACRLLKLHYLPDSHLGSFGGTATAGMLDRSKRAVMLSSKQSFEALRFTAAHEIGHYLLHPEQVLFRDRSLSAYQGGLPPQEQEANRFAATFLMPPKLVRDAFRARFPLGPPLTNTGSTCYALSIRDAQQLEGLPPGSREFAMAVARAGQFNGRYFKSMHSLFNVSVSAMAIRLQELELVH